MSQTDLNAANASGAVFRSDMNAHLDALATLSSGSSAPSTTFANMWWADTSANILKRRNNANTAWISVMSLVTGLIIGTDVEAYDADILKADVSDQVTVGYSGTGYSTGNTGSGTVTLDVANGNEQYGTVTGSFTMGAPTLTGVGYIKWELTNDGTGGYSPDFATNSDLVNGTYDSTASIVNIITIRKMNTKTIVDIEQGQ